MPTNNWYERVQIHGLNLDIECLVVANRRYGDNRYGRDIAVLDARRQELLRRIEDGTAVSRRGEERQQVSALFPEEMK